MCGRFTREYTWQEVHDFLDLKFPKGVKSDEEPEDLDKSYNVAPTQLSLVAHAAQDAEKAEISACKWGLIPHWADEASIGNRMINARAETAAEKPDRRSPLNNEPSLVDEEE